jgi:hypothetical protein
MVRVGHNLAVVRSSRHEQVAEHCGDSPSIRLGSLIACQNFVLPAAGSKEPHARRSGSGCTRPILRASRIVAIPIVIAHRGIYSCAPNTPQLSSNVSRVSDFSLVREPRLDMGSLKSMWPVTPNFQDLQIDSAGGSDRCFVPQSKILRSLRPTRRWECGCSPDRQSRGQRNSVRMKYWKL